MSKTCGVCREVKAISDFYRNRGARDGRSSECKVCKAARQRRDADKHALATKKYDEKNPHKAHARKVVHAAVKRGALVRKKRCSHCGMKGPTQFHHDDYSRPLDVMEVCRQCHKDRHATLEAMGVTP